jgi:hypothetical protein
MAYFQSSQAEYRASRLAQMLGPSAEMIAALPDGRCLANFQGHVHLFKLNREGELEVTDKADLIRRETTPIVTID